MQDGLPLCCSQTLEDIFLTSRPKYNEKSFRVHISTTNIGIHGLLHDIPRFLILFLRQLFFIFNQVLCVSVYLCLVVACWERADLHGSRLWCISMSLSLSHKVWYLIASIPDLCTLTLSTISFGRHVIAIYLIRVILSLKFLAMQLTILYQLTKVETPSYNIFRISLITIFQCPNRKGQ